MPFTPSGGGALSRLHSTPRRGRSHASGGRCAAQCFATALQIESPWRRTNAAVTPSTRSKRPLRVGRTVAIARHAALPSTIYDATPRAVAIFSITLFSAFIKPCCAAESAGRRATATGSAAARCNDDGGDNDEAAVPEAVPDPPRECAFVSSRTPPAPLRVDVHAPAAALRVVSPPLRFPHSLPRRRSSSHCICFVGTSTSAMLASCLLGSSSARPDALTRYVRNFDFGSFNTRNFAAMSIP